MFSSGEANVDEQHFFALGHANIRTNVGGNKRSKHFYTACMALRI